MPSPRIALERADQFIGDPAAVEARNATCLPNTASVKAEQGVFSAL